MPNSRVRSLIENASTPPTPIAAIVSARTANPPNSVAFSRDGATRSAAEAVSHAISVTGRFGSRSWIRRAASRPAVADASAVRMSSAAPGELCVAAS